MRTESPSGALDLLVIGGLTIDRFADGSSAPGGTVLHVARAAAGRGLRLGVVTVAGPEPEADAGLDELRQLAQHLEVAPHAASATFGLQEDAAGRRLRLVRCGGQVQLDPATAARRTARAVLYAPIAGEIDLQTLGGARGELATGAILQGWLRTLTEGAEVRPLRSASLPSDLRSRLGELDVLVASREDLLAEASRPADQLAELRRAFGSGPHLVVTDGRDGLLLGHAGGGEPERLPVPWLVDDVPTVGAGDVLAAFLIAGSPSVAGWRESAATAMRVVAEELDKRGAGGAGG
jgi:sugar/nucleoside kinase (ribokinase family)